MPVYISDIKQLESEQPQSYHFLSDGGFVVRHTEDHGFNAVSTDQALEQTVNRDAKSKGDVVGLTRLKNGLSRWLMTQHITAEYVHQYKKLCESRSGHTQIHKECQKEESPWTRNMLRDSPILSQIIKTLLI